jgi:hypothetical protein
MPGKTCFNFRTDPDPELIAELRQLTAAVLHQWDEKDWV